MPIKKKRCTINGKTVHSIEELYDELSRQLQFPPHFGRNLDALWDVLSTDIEGPFEIVFQNFTSQIKDSNKGFDKVIDILKDLQNERDDFKFVIRKF